MRPTSNSTRRWIRASSVLVAMLLMLASSCRLAKSVVEAPGKAVHSMFDSHDKPENTVPVSMVQTQVMRFADSFGGKIAQATQEFAREANTPQARIQALGWSVWQRSEAYRIASGANAHRNLLDMLVFVTLGRMVHEEYWMPQVWHEADEPMLATLRQAEQDIWSIAEKILSKRQQERVRTTLTAWRESNPNAVLTASTRIPAFQDLVAQPEAAGTNVLEDFAAMLNFDPLSGLEPATREVKQARLLGERTLYYVQHAQLVIPTQLELLSLKLTNQPDVQSALETSERISLAADSLAETAKTLPAEREATVRQISDELTAQRKGLLADLERAGQPTNEILNNARESLEAATEMSTALQGTIVTLDEFVDGLKAHRPAEATDGANGLNGDGAAEPQGKPFDVREYGIAAEHIGDAARDLNGVLVSLDEHLPQVQRVLGEVSQSGDHAINLAFRRGVLLGVILIVTGAIATLCVRWISRRWLRSAS